MALSWSTGKDSAWTLQVLRQNPQIRIAALFTTLNREFDRVAMHAVRRPLLEKQADAAGLPLWTVPLPWPCSNDQYECAMRELCRSAIAQGVSAMAFGDLFLEDVRAYRERQLQDTGLEPLFPLWMMPTRELASRMIASGLKAKITCVDPKALSPDFAGRDFDRKFLADLPAHVDHCGERGEFHSFVYDGPMFSQTIQIEAGPVVERDGFVFADLLPAGAK